MSGCGEFLDSIVLKQVFVDHPVVECCDHGVDRQKQRGRR
jgi:hypothetical protein